MTPLRVQLRRVKGWRMPADTLKADRTTRWGNPFVPGKVPPGTLAAFSGGRAVTDSRHAASLYAGAAPLNTELVGAARAQLQGHNLACWCRLCDLHRHGKPAGERCPDCAPCHVDTLLALANP